MRPPAMLLRKQITVDMKEAMRARDTARLDAVRMLRAAIQRREIDEQAELDDNDVLNVIQKMVKQGRDSIEQFEKGNRQDLVEKETVMLSILETYLPAALSKADVAALITKAIVDTNAESIKDMGKVMSWLKLKLQGRADMAEVNTAVRQRLSI